MVFSGMPWNWIKDCNQLTDIVKKSKYIQYAKQILITIAVCGQCKFKKTVKPITFSTMVICVCIELLPRGASKPNTCHRLSCSSWLCKKGHFHLRDLATLPNPDIRWKTGVSTTGTARDGSGPNILHLPQGWANPSSIYTHVRFLFYLIHPKSTCYSTPVQDKEI